MSTPAIIVTVFAAALIIALIYNSKAIAGLIKFLRMNRTEQEQAIDAAQKDSKYWSGRHDKVSPELYFAVVFLSLSALCAWCGLYYTCGYSFFYGTMMLANGVRAQIRLFILNKKNPNVVDGDNVFEFRTA